MKQLYIIGILMFCFLLSPAVVSAQNSKLQEFAQEKPIAGLSVYPNPVTGGKIYITSSRDLPKEVEIYNVLGKKVLSGRMQTRELDVSELTPGIYILKIKEGNEQTTRKLVVR